MTLTTNSEISVLLVDDHAIVRQGVRAYLETQADIMIIGEAASGEEAVLRCAELAPDVVLLDIVMDGIGGIEAARLIKQESPRTQIIMLTSYHDDEHLLPAIRAGALSYLLKDVAPEELLSAVRKASRGEAVVHPRVASRLMQSLREDSGEIESSLLTPLSVREMEVLRLIAEGRANAQIAEQLFISEKTVKSHVSNILSKLHLNDRTQAAVYAWREGLVEPSEKKPS